MSAPSAPHQGPRPRPPVRVRVPVFAGFVASPSPSAGGARAKPRRGTTSPPRRAREATRPGQKSPPLRTSQRTGRRARARRRRGARETATTTSAQTRVQRGRGTRPARRPRVGPGVGRSPPEVASPEEAPGTKTRTGTPSVASVSFSATSRSKRSRPPPATGVKASRRSSVRARGVPHRRGEPPLSRRRPRRGRSDRHRRWRRVP